MERVDAMEALLAKAAEYDYIRFAFCDLNGVARCKLVTGRNANKFLSEGLGDYSGVMVTGSRGDFPVKAMKKIEEAGHPNLILQPDPWSLRNIPWGGNGDSSKKFAEIMCETYTLEGQPMEICPRYQAQKQLKQLDELGLSLLSAYEMEYRIYEQEGRKPLFANLDYCQMVTLGKYEGFLTDIEKNLYTAGVNIECMHPEYAPGQFEATPQPKVGIAAADDCMVFKHCVKEMCQQKGYFASFMAKPDNGGASTGFHFNFSVWNKATGENALYNEQSEDKLSDIGRYWLAGLMKHGRALAALCSPTVNCYRRVHEIWTPHRCDWGIQNRNALIRVKNGGKGTATYFENRLPSSMCNPYIVMAATLAAGIDGIKNKMQCPPQMQTDAPLIPYNLTEALEALEQDKELVTALSEEFVDWLVKFRREIDLEKLKNVNIKDNSDAAFVAEREEYEEAL